MPKKSAQSISTSSWKKEHYILAIAAAVLIIAAFLTWVTSSLATEGYETAAQSITGIATYTGYLTIAMGLVIIVMFFLKKNPKILAIVFGIISFLAGFLYWYYIKYVPKPFIELQSEVGIGVYLTMLAGIALIVGGWMNKRNS